MASAALIVIVNAHVSALSQRPRARRRALHVAKTEGFESDNPQNVPPPLVGPSPSLSALDAVRIQLEACKANNTPRPDHGVHTLYDFCADAGSMERSRYFGFSKDLYHLDHFLSITAVYPGLFAFDALEVQLDSADTPDTARVRAQLRRGSAASDFIFIMRRVDEGSKRGCWLTQQLLPADSKYLR
jgi:hypothetical protein